MRHLERDSRGKSCRQLCRKLPCTWTNPGRRCSCCGCVKSHLDSMAPTGMGVPKHRCLALRRSPEGDNALLTGSILRLFSLLCGKDEDGGMLLPALKFAEYGLSALAWKHQVEKGSHRRHPAPPSPNRVPHRERGLPQSPPRGGLRRCSRQAESRLRSVTVACASATGLLQVLVMPN